jgi:predicted aspartyl protease
MSFRVVIAAALAAALSASLVPRTALAADDAAALLAKHHAYVGWSSGDGVVKTLRESGTVSGGTAKPAKIAVLRYGVAFREMYENAQGLQSHDGFTGNVFWTSNANGFTLRPIGDVARYLIDDHAVFGELTANYTPAVLRHETVDGTDTVVLHLTHQIGYPMDVYVDPATGAFKRVVIDPNGRYEETINGIEYTEVQGKRFISAYHYGHSKRISRYDAIVVNPEIAPDTLRPPAPSASWTFGEGTQPVELTGGNFPRIYVDVTMNGVKGRFILDTGAASTVLTDRFASRIGAKRVMESRASGIGGSVASTVYRIDSLHVGGSTLNNLLVSTGMPENFDEGENVVGLLGFDLLAGAIVELDFDAKTLQVMDPAKVAPDQSRGLVLHPDLTTQHMRVPMQLNGKIDVIATLDSGNPINVLFSKDLIHSKRVALLADPDQLGSTRYGGGIGNNYEIERCGLLTSLSLGPIEYKPVPACDSDAMGSGNEILVGLDFMKAFNYVFDYPDGIVLLMKRKG